MRKFKHRIEQTLNYLRVSGLNTCRVRSPCLRSKANTKSTLQPRQTRIRCDQPIKTKLTKHIGNQRFGSETDAVRSKVLQSSNRDDGDAQFVMHTIRRQTKQCLMNRGSHRFGCPSELNRMAKPNDRRTFCSRSTVVPLRSARIQFRKRCEQS